MILILVPQFGTILHGGMCFVLKEWQVAIANAINPMRTTFPPAQAQAPKAVHTLGFVDVTTIDPTCIAFARFPDC